MEIGTIVKLKKWVNPCAKNMPIVSDELWQIKSIEGVMVKATRPYVDETNLEIVVPIQWLEDCVQIINDKYNETNY